jgi:hypothetical protein
LELEERDGVDAAVEGGWLEFEGTVAFIRARAGRKA